MCLEDFSCGGNSENESTYGALLDQVYTRLVTAQMLSVRGELRNQMSAGGSDMVNASQSAGLLHHPSIRIKGYNIKAAEEIVN